MIVTATNSGFPSVAASTTTATLVVKYEGEQVLAVSWTVDGVTWRSYTPGAWEAALRRRERMPVLKGTS